MPPVRNLPPGHTIIYPNRDKATSRAAKSIVVLLLLISVLLMLVVTIGGWSELQGLQPINFAWCLSYLPIAFYVARWARGLLPIAAALGVLLLIVALIAGLGAAGTSWFDRSHVGYAAAQTLFGGQGLGANTIGFVTLLLAAVQLVLIVVSMRGFAQGWNVEVEVTEEEAERRRSGGRPNSSPPATAAA